MGFKALQLHILKGADRIHHHMEFNFASDLGHTTLDLPYLGHHHMEFDPQSLGHLDLPHFVSFAWISPHPSLADRIHSHFLVLRLI
jgi:hypothetical protein